MTRIYVDEVDKDFRNTFIVGALYVPPTSGITRSLAEMRACHNFQQEMHFTNMSNARLAVYQDALTTFCACPYCYAHVLVIPCNRLNKGYFDNQKHLTYNFFTKMLLSRKSDGINNAALYVDDMARKKEDNFLPYLYRELNKERFKADLPPLLKKEPETINSKLSDEVQLIDLIVGSVNNELNDPQNPRKTQVRKHLLQSINAASFKKSGWNRKVGVWIWEPNPR